MFFLLKTGLLNLYEAVPPGVILLLGWLMLVIATGWRMSQGYGVPVLNGLFVLAGLGAYFLPTHLGDFKRGQPVRRKLLWLLLLAGVIILAGEFARSLGFLEQS